MDSSPLLFDFPIRRCLVVDDDPQVLEATALLLEAALSCETVRFDRSADAWREFSRAPERYPLVVSDFDMPELDGLELGRRIVGIAPDTDAILCTGNPEGLAGIDLRRFGFRAVLAKPFGLRELRTLFGGVSPALPVDVSARLERRAA